MQILGPIQGYAPSSLEVVGAQEPTLKKLFRETHGPRNSGWEYVWKADRNLIIIISSFFQMWPGIKPEHTAWRDLPSMDAVSVHLGWLYDWLRNTIIKNSKKKEKKKEFCHLGTLSLIGELSYMLEGCKRPRGHHVWIGEDDAWRQSGKTSQRRWYLTHQFNWWVGRGLRRKQRTELGWWVHWLSVGHGQNLSLFPAGSIIMDGGHEAAGTSSVSWILLPRLGNMKAMAWSEVILGGRRTIVYWWVVGVKDEEVATWLVPPWHTWTYIWPCWLTSMDLLQI